MIEECRLHNHGHLYRFRIPMSMLGVPFTRKNEPKPEVILWLDENLPGVKPYVFGSEYVDRRNQWFVYFRRYVDAVAYRMRF